MNQAQAEQLARIYNTLLLVNTKGEDTVIMGDCLRALKQCIEDIQKDMEAAQSSPVVEAEEE